MDVDNTAFNVCDCDLTTKICWFNCWEKWLTRLFHIIFDSSKEYWNQKVNAHTLVNTKQAIIWKKNRFCWQINSMKTENSSCWLYPNCHTTCCCWYQHYLLTVSWKLPCILYCLLNVTGAGHYPLYNNESPNIVTIKALWSAFITVLLCRLW